MSKNPEIKKTIPVISWVVTQLKRVIIPGLEGLSLFEFLRIYFVGLVKGTFSTRAGSVAFSFFMAIFPFLLFILNLIPFVWFIDDFQLKLLSFLDSLLPPQTSEFFNDIFYDIANNPRAGLLSFVFILSVFLMANGVNAVFTGFEYSYHVSINRTIIRQYMVALGVSIIIAFLLLLAVILTIYLTFIIEKLKIYGMFADTGILWAEIGRYTVFIGMVYLISAILYYFGTREGRQMHFFSIGALFTTILIVLTTFLFSIYIENFSTYNELYGSIGALLILMLYIWINSNILLLGFELNAAITKLKKKN
ncbi:membrane protein [Mesonia hippocampi]|uniref:Membrane protein n=1 Tax=Mesonia hippocampi TaxID=1628250 RepID=A0A840EYX1_9FLAO|nr:YihY/virulence factor BrkB family protein [Mesonia hippocampi]MBB4119234.1 membrane protein [Mesonia hippocampi]